ncbi:hypothetical protein ACFL6X_03620 [Candidatus Latescibacterota bacterium]
MAGEADSLEAQIAQQEKRTKELHHDLDTTVQRFREETISFASRWTEEAIQKSVVKDNPDHAAEVGEEAISRLKGEMSQLVGEMPDHVDGALERVRWPHTREQRPFLSFGGGTRRVGGLSAPSPLAEALRTILGRAGHLLGTYGFKGMWKVSQTPADAPVQERWTYNGPLDWPDGMANEFKLYRSVLRQYDEAVAKLDELRTKVKQREAGRLWNEA